MFGSGRTQTLSLSGSESICLESGAHEVIMDNIDRLLRWVEAED